MVLCALNMGASNQNALCAGKIVKRRHLIKIFNKLESELVHWWIFVSLLAQSMGKKINITAVEYVC